MGNYANGGGYYDYCYSYRVVTVDVIVPGCALSDVEGRVERVGRGWHGLIVVIGLPTAEALIWGIFSCRGRFGDEEGQEAV